MPKVSIITAAYNHVRFIRQTLESVQSQTYRDFEHIVVDDGSSDGTSDLLQSFGEKITYIRQENRGAHVAINAGIKASSGEYVAILDSDDAWLPHKLERQIQAFEQSPGAGLVYSQAHIIDSDGKLKEDEEAMGRPVSDFQHAFFELLHDNYIPALTAVFRKDCIERVGYFNEKFRALSDWDLWLRIADQWPILFVPEPLALYRIHANNTWHTLVKNGQVNRERLLLLENAAALTPKDSDNEGKREVIESAFRELALKTAYGLWYRYRYLEASSYTLFALKVRPMLLKDAFLAIRPRFIPRLLVGERGTKLFSWL